MGSLVFTISMSIWLSATSIPMSESANILFLIPMSTYSEKHFFIPIYTELAKLGHKVTLVTNEPSPQPNPNITEVVPCTVEDTFGRAANIEHSPNIYWDLIFLDNEYYIPVYDKIYTNPEFKELVLGPKFDLIFVNFYFGPGLYGIVEKNQCPFIILNSLGLSNYFIDRNGNYAPPSHIPFPLTGYSDKMSFTERLVNFVVDWAVTLHAEFNHYPVFESVYRKHLGQHLSPIKEIQKNASLIMTNTHFLTNFHRPLMPDVVEIGGIHCREAKPLPEVSFSFIVIR